VKFSIVTPSFNQGCYLQDCIDSVVAQREAQWEHLVIDAGSTDETLQIIRRHPHLNWASEPDRGMSDGINKGFLKATGDWVMWLNTDDYLLPGALARIARYAAENPAVDVIYGDCIFVDAQKKVLRRKRDHRFDLGVLLFYGCYIASTSTFIKRSVIQAGHLLDLDYRNCMDFEYYLRLSREGFRFGYLPEALAAFRWHDTNTSTRHADRRHQERLAIQRDYLRKAHRGFLGSAPLLSVLKRVYQGKRLLLRGLTRHV
jgi:glycosyltransferase involved in cell wall biosynthesis